MIRRLRIGWPRPLAVGVGRDRPLRLLAVSDEAEPSFDFEANRDAIGPIDVVLGCGDLDPAYLSFLADAFCVPLLYVRGNHDRGANWQAWQTGREHLPRSLNRRVEQICGLAIGGLSWPGDAKGRAEHDDRAAWRQALYLALRSRLGRSPLIVLSHVPPSGLGDTPEDVYHRGFAAYRWLCRRLRPVLWLHGHTAPAASPGWRVEWGATTLVNVTGAVLIEIDIHARHPATIAAGPSGEADGRPRQTEEA